MPKFNDDGGYAFPVPMVYDGASCDTVNERGMSLRDYFAARAPFSEAMATAAAESVSGKNPGVPYGELWCQLVAAHAYRYADAMLAERAKR